MSSHPLTSLSLGTPSNKPQNSPKRSPSVSTGAHRTGAQPPASSALDPLPLPPTGAFRTAVVDPRFVETRREATATAHRTPPPFERPEPTTSRDPLLAQYDADTVICTGRKKGRYGGYLLEFRLKDPDRGNWSCQEHHPAIQGNPLFLTITLDSQLGEITAFLGIEVVGESNLATAQIWLPDATELQGGIEALAARGVDLGFRVFPSEAGTLDDRGFVTAFGSAERPRVVVARTGREVIHDWIHIAHMLRMPPALQAYLHSLWKVHKAFAEAYESHNPKCPSLPYLWHVMGQFTDSSSTLAGTQSVPLQKLPLEYSGTDWFERIFSHAKASETFQTFHSGGWRPRYADAWRSLFTSSFQPQTADLEAPAYTRGSLVYLINDWTRVLNARAARALHGPRSEPSA